MNIALFSCLQNVHIFVCHLQIPVRLPNSSAAIFCGVSSIPLLFKPNPNSRAESLTLASSAYT
jgi:hypothetical protein